MRLRPPPAPPGRSPPWRCSPPPAPKRASSIPATTSSPSTTIPAWCTLDFRYWTVQAGRRQHDHPLARGRPRLERQRPLVHRAVRELDHLVEVRHPAGNAELAERRAADAGPVPVRPGGAHPAGAAAEPGLGLRARDRPGVPDRHRPDPAQPQPLLPARLRFARRADRAQLPVAAALSLEPLAALRRAGLRRARSLGRLAAAGPAVASCRPGAVRHRCRSGRARSTGRRPISPARSTPGAATCSRRGSSTTSRPSAARCRRCAGSARTPPRSAAGSPRGCESRNAPRA